MMFHNSSKMTKKGLLCALVHGWETKKNCVSQGLWQLTVLGSEHKSPCSPFSWAWGWKVSELCKYLGCFSLLVIKYWTSACAVSCPTSDSWSGNCDE
jgi:hypothetical protein